MDTVVKTERSHRVRPSSRYFGTANSYSAGQHIPCFYVIIRFTVFTKARHWSLSWTTSIQNTPSDSCLNIYLIVSSHLHLDLPMAEHVMSSVAQKLGCVSALFCFVSSCVGSGLATGWSPIQGVLSNVQKQIRFRSQILNWKRPQGLIRIHFLFALSYGRTQRPRDVGLLKTGIACQNPSVAVGQSPVLSNVEEFKASELAEVTIAQNRERWKNVTFRPIP